MRLSEAIFMGRHTIDRPLAGCIDACAIPMALNAAGVKMDIEATDGIFRCYAALAEEWPWLNKMSGTHCPFCKPYCHEFGSGSAIRGIVPHVFDNHVCTKQITLEQMCDWLRTIEPDEPAATPGPSEAHEAIAV